MAAPRAARRTQGSVGGDTSCATLRPDSYPVKTRGPACQNEIEMSLRYLDPRAPRCPEGLLAIEPQVVIGRFDVQQPAFLVSAPRLVLVEGDGVLQLGETLPLGHAVGDRGPEVLEKLAHAGDFRPGRHVSLARDEHVEVERLDCLHGVDPRGHRIPVEVTPGTGPRLQ